MKGNDEILTVKEAAEYAKVCEKTMYTWTNIAGFPKLKIGNCVRIPKGLFLAWLNDQAMKGATL